MYSNIEDGIDRIYFSQILMLPLKFLQVDILNIIGWGQAYHKQVVFNAWPLTYLYIIIN